MKNLIALFFVFKVSILSAQYTVHIVVTCPANTNQIYIAGTFNGWDPENENYKLQPTATGKQQVILHNIQKGKIEFKFAKRKLKSVESNGKAANISNREINIKGDTALLLNIAGWIDDYIDVSKLSDSAKFVAMMEKGFYFLDRNLDSSDKYAADIYSLALKLLLHIQLEALRYVICREMFLPNGD